MHLRRHVITTLVKHAPIARVVSGCEAPSCITARCESYIKALQRQRYIKGRGAQRCCTCASDAAAVACGSNSAKMALEKPPNASNSTRSIWCVGRGRARSSSRASLRRNSMGTCKKGERVGDRFLSKHSTARLGAHGVGVFQRLLRKGLLHCNLRRCKQWWHRSTEQAAAICPVVTLTPPLAQTWSNASNNADTLQHVERQWKRTVPNVPAICPALT